MSAILNPQDKGVRVDGKGVGVKMDRQKTEDVAKKRNFDSAKVGDG